MNNGSLDSLYLQAFCGSACVEHQPATVVAPTDGTLHQCMAVSQVTDEIRADWEAIRSRNAALRSPFFSVEFTETVEKIRGGLQVGLLKGANGVRGVLPFRRKGMNAFPPARGINDAHGLITDEDTKVDSLECIRAFGINHYHFHASPRNNPLTCGSGLGTVKTFQADLTVDPAGYEHFLRSKSSTVDRQDQKTRRLQRELGPMRFEFDCRDEAMLELLLRSKCQQYVRNHNYQILAVDWIRDLIFHLFRNQNRSVRGILNVLYFGSTPVALHFGLIEGDLLHYWYQVYSPDCGHGSPGTQLFLEVAREAAARGIRTIEMGLGEQAYKAKLTNVVTEMDRGILSTSYLRRQCFRASSVLAGSVKKWSWYQHLKPITRRALPNFGSTAYTD